MNQPKQATMNKHVTITEAEAMIGKRVKAVGCCGITDGVNIVGTLDRMDNGDVIVKITYGSRVDILPCLAIRNTLELANGSCDNCDNAISDSEAFNQICFECGKKV